MEKIMNLVLVRHGESVWNKANRFTGWTDVELSEKGKLEAKNAGKILMQRGLDFDICYTSFLKRAIITLEIILYTLDKLWLPVVKSPMLNERHYGALQGLCKLDTAKKYGEAQVKIWRRSFNVRPPSLKINNLKNSSAYEKIHVKVPLTESLEDVLFRVSKYFENEIKPKILNSKKILIVAHGNTIRALAKYFEDMTEEELINLEIPTGIPLVYEFDSKFNVVEKYFLNN